MVTLTLQFLIVAVLPISGVTLAIRVWRADLKRPSLRGCWIFTLLALAVWASSLLRLFGGTALSTTLVYNWGIVGRYAMLATTVGVLLTTLERFSAPRRLRLLTLGLSLLLGVLAFVLDPSVGISRADTLLFVGQRLRLFDLWAGVWMAAWIVALLAAWLVTQQVRHALPASLYRNQTDYWLLTLALFGAGHLLASVQQPGQPIWQEFGILVAMLAAWLGTTSLIRSLLPDLRLAVWQLAGRLAATALIFGLLWVSFVFVRSLPAGAGTNLILVLLPALLAALVAALFRGVNTLAQRRTVPGVARDQNLSFGYSSAIGYAPEPAQLGQLLLRVVQFNLATDDGWIFLAHDGPGGSLILRPLTTLSPDGESITPETAVLHPDSPFAAHIRSGPAPLLQIDVDTLDAFDTLPPDEEALLLGWQRVLFMPLRAGESLVGLLALGPKYAGEAYTRDDIDGLHVYADRVAPLLVQAQNLATLRRLNDYVFDQNRRLVREKQRLEALVAMQADFIELVSPELQRPLSAIYPRLAQLPDDAPRAELEQAVDDIRAALGQIINLANRVQTAADYHPERVQLEDITRRAIRGLSTMSNARRVSVRFEHSVPLPVFGDEQRLQEAIQNVLHNAIKFNRIGGEVIIEGGTSGRETYLHVRDTGVGMPPERLETLWNGFPPLDAIPYNRRNGSRPAGIGLAFAQFIITAHGGHLEAQSQYGSGSEFSIYLPVPFDHA